MYPRINVQMLPWIFGTPALYSSGEVEDTVFHYIPDIPPAPVNVVSLLGEQIGPYAIGTLFSQFDEQATYGSRWSFALPWKQFTPSPPAGKEYKLLSGNFMLRGPATGETGRGTGFLWWRTDPVARITAFVRLQVWHGSQHVSQEGTLTVFEVKGQFEERTFWGPTALKILPPAIKIEPTEQIFVTAEMEVRIKLLGDANLLFGDYGDPPPRFDLVCQHKALELVPSDDFDSDAEGYPKPKTVHKVTGSGSWDWLNPMKWF